MNNFMKTIPIQQRQGTNTEAGKAIQNRQLPSPNPIVNAPYRYFSSVPIQTKLRIGSPNDKYEREADAMADRIVRMPMDTISTKSFSSSSSAIQTKCATCEDDKIQRKPLMMKSEGGGGVATSELNSLLNSTKASGTPMPAFTNQFMSNAFSSDFSGVRVHTGSKAIQMNQGLNARAFTHGSDIYFNKGQYQPGSFEGKKLLGHELTHVVQQKAGNKLSLKNQIQRTCHPESHYISASNYCRDDTFSPSTHPGKTCYRQIPIRSSYFSCPPGEHVCFDGNGHCEDSPDRSSLAESKESGGECNWNGYCYNL